MKTNDNTSKETTAPLLIKEELKSRKFFRGLRELGLDDAFYQTDLIELIMAQVGLDADDPEHYLFCNELLDKHSERVVEDVEETVVEAKMVYWRLCKKVLV